MNISKDRFALGSFQYLKYPLEYFFDTAVLLGIRNVELLAAAPHLYLDVVDEKALKKIQEQLLERDLSVISLTPEQTNYPVNIAAEEEDLRKHSINTFAIAIDVAVELNCPMVLVTSGYGYYNRSRKDAWERAAESLRYLASTAHKKGIKLVLETLTPLSSNLVNNPSQQMKMLSEMPEDTMTAMVDIGQMVFMNQTIDEYQKILGKDLSHVHLHDSHPDIHMALGDGDLPVTEYLEFLERNNYKGYYSFECNEFSYRKNPREADIRNMEYLKKHNILI
ncbi:protein FrlC [Dethiosulfatibacter aminovorans DSM 17477]|uniref:Protein FrlC n=1 Tax=Dethiosulfatibacter aminovorans DSM 17477 TaxID=1121476 RepID=A0A1M6GKM1_9FIRM|nr:sugar phosphate isomerase/epimerase family protein [Dethiosulfatibacter aminovorans]SHJ10491.1 protein FrlC [Dethiosulfatibacter aminovorans DSM 17477]